jgi:cytochrome bd-type quinol oxidase subunit 1
MKDLLRKKNFRVMLYIFRLLPYIIALFYLLATVFNIVGIDSNWVAHIFYLSIISWGFLIYTSFLFKFCVHHRVPLYYILLNDLISMVNELSYVNIETITFCRLHIILLGICLFIYLWLYLKYKKYDKYNKESAIANSR